VRYATSVLACALFASTASAECKYWDIDLKQGETLMHVMEDSTKNLHALAVGSDPAEKLSFRIVHDDVELSTYSFAVLKWLRVLRDEMKVAADRNAVDEMAADILNTASRYFDGLADYLTAFSARVQAPGMASEATALRDDARQFVRLLRCE
jgi:hypothetical protein